MVVFVYLACSKSGLNANNYRSSFFELCHGYLSMPLLSYFLSSGASESSDVHLSYPAIPISSIASY